MKKYESPEIKVNVYTLDKDLAVNLGSDTWYDEEFDNPEE